MSPVRLAALAQGRQYGGYALLNGCNVTLPLDITVVAEKKIAFAVSRTRFFNKQTLLDD